CEWDISIGGDRFTPYGSLYGFEARTPRSLGDWQWVGRTEMFEPAHDDDWDPLAFVVRLRMRDDERAISEAMRSILERGAMRSAALVAVHAAGHRFLWAEHDTRATEFSPEA